MSKPNSCVSDPLIKWPQYELTKLAERMVEAHLSTAMEISEEFDLQLSTAGLIVYYRTSKDWDIDVEDKIIEEHKGQRLPYLAMFEKILEKP